MADVPPVKAGGADDAIAKMEATFNMAIEKSAKITEISTAKKSGTRRHQTASAELIRQTGGAGAARLLLARSYPDS